MVGAVLVAVAAPGVANADNCGVGGPVTPGAPGNLGGPGDCGTATGNDDTPSGGHATDTTSSDSTWPPGAGDYGSGNGSASPPASPIVTPVQSAP